MASGHCTASVVLVAQDCGYRTGSVGAGPWAQYCGYSRRRCLAVGHALRFVGIDQRHTQPPVAHCTAAHWLSGGPMDERAIPEHRSTAHALHVRHGQARGGGDIRALLAHAQAQERNEEQRTRACIGMSTHMYRHVSSVPSSLNITSSKANKHRRGTGAMSAVEPSTNFFFFKRLRWARARPQGFPLCLSSKQACPHACPCARMHAMSHV